MVVLGLFLTWRVRHKNEDAIWLWGMSVVCEIWFAFSWLLDQLPKLCPVNRATDLNVLKEKFETPTLSNPTGKSDLPGVDVFVSTADPEKEPPLVTSNTILSILAADYPVEKLACYVSDDGGALLTFEAMAEAASFANVWVPFCRKHNIEPRNPESYFSLKKDPTKNKVRTDFVKDRRRIKREYDEYKVRINGLPDSIQRRSDVYHVREEIKALKLQRQNPADEPLDAVKIPKATWMADGTHWPGTWMHPSPEHSKGDLAGIIQRIPRKFMNEFKGELLSEVNLRGPSGNIWTTKLVREEEDVFVQHGWEVFAKDHGLNEYDFLVFEYSAKSSFDVLIFDPTGCEREGSYYADRNLNPSTKHCCSIREAANPHTNVNEAQMHDEGDESLNHDVFSANEQCSEELSNKLDYSEDDQEDQTSFSGEESDGRNLSNKGYRIRLIISSRRHVTRDEEMAVLKKAKAQFESSKKKDQSKLPYWIIAMKPSHVSRGFTLTIPKQLADLYLPKKSQVIELRVTPGEKTWEVQFNRWKQQFTLSKGWVEFVLDNNLEVSDVCVLAPSATGRSSVLNISIYRVVEDIAELKVL